MNEFYQRKAAVPREAKTGNLRERLIGWRDKRLLSVAAACEKTPDSFRQKFGILHTGFANTVDKILAESDENLVEEIEGWINSLEESFHRNEKGASHDAIGLCGAELKSILKNYLEANP